VNEIVEKRPSKRNPKKKGRYPDLRAKAKVESRRYERRLSTGGECTALEKKGRGRPRWVEAEGTSDYIG